MKKYNAKIILEKIDEAESGTIVTYEDINVIIEASNAALVPGIVFRAIDNGEIVELQNREFNELYICIVKESDKVM